MKKILLRIKLFFATIFGNLDKFLTDNVDEAINMVDAVKKVVDSGFVGVIVNLTPTQVDNKVLDKAKEYLDIAARKLQITNECASLATQEQRLACLVKALADASPNVRNALYLKLASLYTKAKALKEDNKVLATSDVDTLVQLRYKDVKL